MIPTEFDPLDFDRGQKHVIDLNLGPWVEGFSLPLLLVRGRLEGPTLVVTAGVHGDEYEGVRAIFEMYLRLNPDEMAGDMLAVPVANPPAFWNGTRTSPLDDGNLARAFPGRPDGGPTSMLAHVLGTSIISHADFYLDLHSAGVQLLMPTMAGYDSADPRSRAAAVAFGAPVLWGHPDVAPGRTISYAKEHGIPWLYTEARGAGRIHPDDLRVMTTGIRNLLLHLQILQGELEQSPVLFHLFGGGNIDDSLRANRAGFLIPDVNLLDPVTRGMKLGRTVDLHAEDVEIFVAARNGVVALIREWPVVKPGDVMFLLTDVENQKQ